MRTEKMLANFKRLTIVFWFFWWLIAFITDLFGFINNFSGARITWANNDNFHTLQQSLAFTGWSHGIIWLFYTGIIIWLVISTIAFFLASISAFQPGTPQKKYWVNLAFIVTLLFWMAFFLADQCVMRFPLEQNHMVQGGFELLSYLSLFILPT